MITILNTSILTEYGDYSYLKISLQQARDLITESYNPMTGDPSKCEGWQSAIGHESTAKIISTLLDIDCPVNRIQYSQEVGERALVFKLNGRPEEGKILSIGEIEEMGYSWGLLIRVP